MKYKNVKIFGMSLLMAIAGISLEHVNAKSEIKNVTIENLELLKIPTEEEKLYGLIEHRLEQFYSQASNEQAEVLSGRITRLLEEHDTLFPSEYELLTGIKVVVDLALEDLNKQIGSFEDDIEVILTKVYSNEVVAKTDMKDYIMGVLYIECGDPNNTSLTEYYKAMAIMAKTFGLRRGGYVLHSNTNTIQLRNGNADQGYCPVDQGCHVKFDSSSAVIPSIIPGTGVDDDNRYSHGKPVLTDEFSRNELTRYYEETRGYVLVNGEGVLTGGNYDNSLQIEMQNLARNGASYQDILKYACPKATLTYIEKPIVQNEDKLEELEMTTKEIIYQKVR